MVDNESSGKAFLQYLEGFLSLLSKLEWDFFVDETGEWNNSIRVIKDKVSVEIGEAKKRLNVFYLPKAQANPG